MLEQGVDTGDVVASVEFPIEPEDDARSIVDRTLELFPPMLIDAIRKLKQGRIERLPQNHAEAVQYTRRYPRDGNIDWRTLTAQQVHNLTRALVDPYGGAFTYFYSQRVFIHRTQLLPNEVRGVPGRVVLRTAKGVVVCAADRGLLLVTVQVEGDAVNEARNIFLDVGIDLSYTP